MSVTLDEVKNYLRVDYEEDDTLIVRLIDTAYAHIEMFTQRTIATWQDKPVQIDLAAMLLVAHWYEHRLIVFEKNVNPVAIPYNIQMLLNPYRPWISEDWIQE